ncbi:MAG: nodulation protein NfeD [Dehalococcoidia bacterium]|nr:nodulation protein NfeD [Dehalococcoidia bacterium]MDW8119210.1 nodulation protein NfeD [Chloroflexota bacterium]
MVARFGLAFLLATLLVFLLALPLMAATPQVVVLRVKGTINPALTRYIERGLDEAERRSATAAVIMLDTPGGLDESMREIIQRIINARVPVIVYVAPAGARAASAGTFITLSAHIAAMAPGTEIGAATPVPLGGTDQQADSRSPMQEKILNDAVAYIRSLAQLRGRNAEWAEKAVRESASVPADEAKALRIVEEVAPDLPTLLQQVHGRRVSLLMGEATLQTAHAQVVYVDMSLIEQFLVVISNPNIAFILLSLALLALFFEFANPGSIVPGVVGAILLLLALFSLGTLPINWAGVLLIVLAFILFVAEVFVTSYGALGIGGAIALILGGLLLMSSAAPPNLRVNPWLVSSVALAIAAFFIVVVRTVVQDRLRRQPVTGGEGLTGQRGVARTPLDPYGTVMVEGERWQAVSLNGRIEEGEPVVVEGRDGLTLRVRRLQRRD